MRQHHVAAGPPAQGLEVYRLHHLRLRSHRRLLRCEGPPLLRRRAPRRGSRPERGHRHRLRRRVCRSPEGSTRSAPGQPADHRHIAHALIHRALQAGAVRPARECGLRASSLLRRRQRGQLRSGVEGRAGVDRAAEERSPHAASQRQNQIHRNHRSPMPTHWRRSKAITTARPRTRRCRSTRSARRFRMRRSHSPREAHMRRCCSCRCRRRSSTLRRMARSPA